MSDVLKILVACEFSQVVTAAFCDAGHNAMSCDLLPAEQGYPHHQGDVLPLLERDWDLLISHPVCRYLANSGVRWLYNKDGSENADRWNKMFQGAAFFREFLNADHIPYIAIENPVQHRHAGLPKPTFTCQPWEYGTGETKRICWWLKNLPPLEPTNIVEGREARVHRMAPGPDREKERSRFFPGVAEAMADQWCRHILGIDNGDK